ESFGISQGGSESGQEFQQCNLVAKSQRVHERRTEGRSLQAPYRRLMKGIFERGGWRCQKCGSLEHLQIHHKVHRSQQGDDALRNLVTLCAYCHLEEHGQLSYSSAATQVSRPTSA